MATTKLASLYNIPNLSGKTAIVTGGNSGLGLKTAMELVRNNANVVITCRSETKGETAIEKIKKEIGTTEAANNISYGVCDLSDFTSIKGFVDSYTKEQPKLDIFVANAGVSTVIADTKSGHQLTPTSNQEMMMQANYLGHFALVHGLLPLLMKSDAPRVVSCSTAKLILDWTAKPIDFDDFNWSKRASMGKYDMHEAYLSARLAQQLMTIKLNQEFEKANKTNGVAALFQPGLVERPDFTGQDNFPLIQFLRKSIDEGVVTHLRAAADPNVQPNEFLEPMFGITGSPVARKIPTGSNTCNMEIANQLWDLSKNIVEQN